MARSGMCGVRVAAHCMTPLPCATLGPYPPVSRKTHSVPDNREQMDVRGVLVTGSIFGLRQFSAVEVALPVGSWTVSQRHQLPLYLIVYRHSVGVHRNGVRVPAWLRRAKPRGTAPSRTTAPGMASFRPSLIVPMHSAYSADFEDESVRQLTFG